MILTCFLFDVYFLDPEIRIRTCVPPSICSDLRIHRAVADQHGEAADEDRLRGQLHHEALLLSVHQLLLLARLHRILQGMVSKTCGTRFGS